MVYIKMYMSEISEFKISDLKAQKMIILWTVKHVSAISEHPVQINGLQQSNHGDSSRRWRSFLEIER